tara:strand:- start:4453 stop:5730 length:1278 start_codon:yes stop_codon:yes gene_type:complete
MKDLIYHLKRLQHRGKDGYGMVYLEDKSLVTIKNKGEIKNDIHDRILDIYSKSCIGHLRYSTSGDSVKNGKVYKQELQPLRGFSHDIGSFYIGHNGNIPNIKIHDTTYIKNILEKDTDTFEKKLIKLMNTIPAAFSIVILTNNNDMYIMRDRFGIRPLCFGENNNKIYVSSESCSFNKNIKYIRDVYPGEIIKINNDGYRTIYQQDNSKLNLCSFEILYFLNEESFVDGLNIKNVRKNLGKVLAKKEDLLKDKKDYVVTGIPLTGILYGKSYAETLNFHYKQLIYKNEDIGRTFIILNDNDRKRACNDKFIYHHSEIRGKNVILVDDTIVRGNVIKCIIKNFKKFGAKEIHVRIPAPPVIDICELGISIQTKEELIMHNKTVDEVCNEIGADSLVYLTIDELEFFPKDSYNQCFSGYINPEIKLI